MSRAILEKLSKEAAEKVASRRTSDDKRFKYLRRNESKDKASEMRPAFVRDVEKILNSAYYNRLSDKTQVLSFYHNDDITRRALHVQLVSRIARTLGAALGLNADLIEAIAIGHDIGHTPFGHAGEKILDELLRDSIGLRFNHNVQSVRILDKIFRYNLTLETLDGILCHNGEMPSDNYTPIPLKDFADFDERVAACMKDSGNIKKLIPATKEGCVVRICDMIAYLGKDRQDYIRAGLGEEKDFCKNDYAENNAALINNFCVNIVNNSWDGECIRMDEKHFETLTNLKKENYNTIYLADKVVKHYDDTIRPMMTRLFEKLVDDLKKGDESSFVFRHHIKFVDDRTKYIDGAIDEYLRESPELIVADYLASCSDDYFLALYEELFGIKIKGYFN